MWFALAVPLALADADRPLLRVDQVARPARFQKVTPGPPARARLKGGGPYVAWVWRDGVIEHYERSEKGRLVESAYFDPHGVGVLTVGWADGRPARAEVPAGDHAAVFDTSAWAWVPWPAEAPVAQLLLPVGADPAAGVAFGAGTLRLDVLPPGADPLSDTFRDGLAATCACQLVDRNAVIVDGAAGVRYLALTQRGLQPELLEIWAVPTPKGTLAAVWATPGVEPEDLGGWARATAPARVVLTIARWERAR